MNDEVLQDLFNRAVSLGYKKSIEDFKTLVNTNDQVLNDNFEYVKGKGYGKGIEDFKVLLGGQEQVVEETITEDPLKKKEDTIQEVEEDTVSVSEDGSLASQDVQPRAYGQQTPLDFGGALSLQPKSEEEESAMLSAAKSYAEGLPEPEEEGFNLAEARLKDETEQTFAEPSMEEDPRTFAGMFGEKFKREKDARAEYSEGTLPFVPVSSPEERERIDLENYTFDANSANNLRREMFAKQGIDSPETDEALKDNFISDKELDEYVERRKKFYNYIDDVVTKNKREKAAVYSAVAEAQGLEPLTMGEYQALYEEGKLGAKNQDRLLFKEFTEQVRVDLSQEELDAIDQKNKELRAQGQEPVPYDFYFNQKRNELFDEYVRSKGLLPSQKKQRIDQAIMDVDARALAPSTYGDIFDTTIDLTSALDEETRMEKAEEIHKNKIKRDYVISNIPSEKFINNANQILSKEGFRKIKKEADENFYNDFGEQEWQTYIKISGNTDPSLLGTEYEDENKDDSVLNKAVVIGDEDATVKNLQAMFPEFLIEGTGTVGEYITISTLSPEGEVVNSLEVYLEEENEPVKRIREFMQGALLTKKDKTFLNTDKSQSGNPLWRLDMYEYMLINPQKFGNHDAPSMYGTDRAYETVKFDDIKKFIDQHEDDIPEERLEVLNKLIEYADYYYKNQRRQTGSFASALSAGVMSGVSGPAKFAVNQMANVADAFGAEGAKEAKDGVITAIESMQNQISGTDPESIAERNLLQTVINTMASSGSAMALGMGNPYATFGAFLTQTSPAVERLLKDEDMPEYQKGLMGFFMGSVEGALETYGAQALLTPASKGMFKGIVIDAIKNLPGDASQEIIDLAIRSSIKAKLKAGVLQVAGGMVTEAATEAQQSIADDLNKRFFNAVYEKDVFDVPDWTTKEGRMQWAAQIIESAKLGALSGGGFATIMHAPRALKSSFKNKSQNKKFKNLYHTFSNASNVQQAKVEIQKGIDEGFIDRKTGEEYLNDWEEGYSVMSKIPAELSMNLKREAYVLLSEKQQIEKKVAGKDKALEKKNYDRLKEINDALEFIGSQADTQQEEAKTKQQLKEERDAISKQETTPVDEDQQATDVQEVEKGAPTAATEETAVEETTTEQVAGGAGIKVSRLEQDLTEEQVEELWKNESQDSRIELEETAEEQLKKEDSDRRAMLRSIGQRTEKKPITDKQIKARAKELLAKKSRESSTQVAEEIVEKTTPVVEEAIKKETKEKPRFKDAKVPVGRKTFTVTNSVEGTTKTYAVTEYLDGSEGDLREILEDGDYTDTKDFGKLKSFKDIKEVFEKNEGVSVEITKEENYKAVMNPKMFDKLTTDQQQRVDSERAKTTLTEEQQEVISLEEEIEGKITEGRELPGQEQVVEEVTEEVTEEAPVDDRQLIYDESKTRSKGQQLVIDRAKKAIKALSKIIPDTKIIIHESSKDFKNATGKDGSGALIEGTIHINMDKANNRTLAHEVMHAVLVKKLGTESDIRKVTARMLESVKKGLVDGGGKVQITTTEVIDGKEVKTTQDVTIEEYLDKFAENYEENMQNEEKVVELAGLLANNYANLKVKEKGVIRRWIQKIFKPIAKQLGININDATKTDKDIIDFLNVVSRKTTTGDVITETETEVLTKVKEEAPAVKKKVTKEKGTTKKKTRSQKADIEVSENEIIFDKVPPKEVLSSILRSLKSRLRAEDIYFNDTVVEVFEDYVKGNEVNINAENYPIQIQEALEGDDMTYGEIANMLRIAGLYDTNAAALKGISEIGKKAGVDMMLQVQEEVDKIADRFQSDFSDKETKLSFVYDKNGERFNKLKRDGFITTDKKIKDYDGQIMFLHQPDGAFSGMIYKDGELLVEGSGGMYYPIKFHQDGFFWASTKGAAEAMAKKLNESMDQNGGKLLMGLITAPSDKLLSSTTMSNAVMDFFSSKAFDDTFNLTENQLRVALRKAANQKLVQVDKKTGKKKTTGLNLNIPASASIEQIKSEIQEKLGYDNSSFQDRKFFATELIGNMAEVINRSQASVDQFGKLFSEGIQNEYFKGVTKTGKLKISKANMVQALSEMFTEPVLKSEGLREQSGQVYAVLELDSKVEPVKSDKHKSYPFALKSVNKDAKVKINVLEEGQLWGEVFEDPATNDIITKERLLNVLPTNAGVSTQGLRVNTSRLDSQETSEAAVREQKSLIQIGRYYNANNQGFFPAQVNEFQLRRDLEAIGLGLKRASSGAYYPTRNGRKVNIFPTPPSPYARFQRAEIDITEPTVFNKKDAAEDIIRTARKKGYNDKSIRFYLLNRRKGEFKAKEVDALLKLDATLFEQLPESFAEIEGGAMAGLKLYEKIDKFRQKLMDQNNRIKKPFLEEQQIQELVKEKNEELKKQGLSKEEVRKKLEAFEKKERANNKKRTKRLTPNEIMDKTIEFLEQQPEYKKSGDSYVEKGVVKYRKGISTQQAKMQAELQETIGQPPTRDMAESLAKLKKNVKAWEKGQRDLQAIKNELKRIMRKHLPKEMYTKGEALKLIKAISDANADNINDQIGKVQELVVKKTNERLTSEAIELLNLVTEQIQSGRLKGVKVSNEVRKRLDAIKENVLESENLSEKDGEFLMRKNAELTKEFNEINQQVTQTQEDLNKLNDLQIAIALNQAQELAMNDSYRIASMQSAINSLDRLIVGGRGAFQAELEQAHAEYQKQFSELWEQITGQKLDMSDPDVQDKINERLKEEVSRQDREEGQNRFRRILSMMYRITGQGINNHEALFGLMDKINVMPGELAGGRIQEIVTERVDEASIKYKGRMMEQQDIIRNKAEEIFGRRWKKKMRQFQSKTENTFKLDLADDRPSLSQVQMAYLYNQFKDPSLHPTFENMLGENYEEIMKDLESKLDPKLKEWADWMVDEYFPSVYNHYNETYKKIYRTDMPFNQNYAGRIFREGVDNNKPLDLLGNASIYQTSIAPGSTKVREKDAKNNILPMDINNALLSYVQDMEYFAAYAEPMRDINKMFNNNNTSKFLKKVYGKNIQELIQNQIQKISGKGPQNDKRARIINYLNNSFVYAKIALSPVVFVKQLTSIFTYANDIGYGNWLKYSGAAALKTPLGMGKTWREITNNSVYIQDRAKGTNIKRAIGNYYDAKNQLLNNSFLEASQKALLITTRAGDKLAIMLGGMPNYLYYKAQYKKQNPQATEQEVIDYAVKKFEKDTKQTQQSSDLQDRDYYQTSDGFMRAMNMFLTTPKQYLRKEIIALRNLRRMMNGKAARGTAFENVRQFFTYHFVMPMLFQWVAAGFPTGDDWDEEDTDDMIRAAIIGNLNGAFVLGDMLSTFSDFVQGKPWAADLNNIPLFIQAADLVKAAQNLGQKVNAKEPDPDKIREARWDLFAALGGLFGLPGDQINKARRNIDKFDQETDVKKQLLRILNYSDYIIEGPKEKKKKKKKKGGIQPLKPLDGSGIKPLKPLGYTEKEEEKKDLSPMDALIKGLTEYY